MISWVSKACLASNVMVKKRQKKPNQSSNNNKKPKNQTKKEKAKRKPKTFLRGENNELLYLGTSALYSQDVNNRKDSMKVVKIIFQLRCAPY